MVLSSKDIELVKLDVQFDYKLASLWETRNMTRSYIIQCLADREIQKRLRHEGYLKSKEFRHNCSVIHNPDNYSHVNQILYFILLITLKIEKLLNRYLLATEMFGMGIQIHQCPPSCERMNLSPCLNHGSAAPSLDKVRQSSVLSIRTCPLPRTIRFLFYSVCLLSKEITQMEELSTMMMTAFLFG